MVHRIIHLRSVRRLYGSSMVCQKTVRFIYGLSEGYMVHLRPVGRPYGSFMARQKAVQFILRTINRTYCQLKAPFGRQLKGTSGGISYEFPLCFMVLFLCISFLFLVLLKQITEAIYKRFYFSNTASV
jgi:hypothetical protein